MRRVADRLSAEERCLCLLHPDTLPARGFCGLKNQRSYPIEVPEKLPTASMEACGVSGVLLPWAGVRQISGVF